MKKFIVSLALAASLALPAVFSTGCTTTGTGQSTFDLQKATNAIRATVPIAVRLAIQNKPETEQYFRQALVVITLLGDNGKFDPTELHNALMDIPVPELQTPEVLASIDGAVGLYRLAFGEVVSNKLSQVQWLGPVLAALGDSIREGLAVPKPQ
jgi:hypothetical protein